MSADTAAVVVRWRGGEEVARCLAALVERGGPRLAEMILVDSGSGDGGGAELAARFPTVRLVALESNRGFAFAADRGAAATTAPLLLLLNPDAEVTPGALDVLAGHLDGRPGVAGAVPLLRYPDGRPQHRWQLRRLPGPWRLAAGLAGAPAFVSPPAGPAPVPQPAAACWLVRREVWDALGGLDPAFVPAWWEDVDFCARLAAGLEAGTLPAAEGFQLAPGATVQHSGGGSAARLGDAAFITAYLGNLLRYASRHHPDALPAIRLGLTASLLARATLRPRQASAYLRALREVRRAATSS